MRGTRWFLSRLATALVVALSLAPNVALAEIPLRSESALTKGAARADFGPLSRLAGLLAKSSGIQYRSTIRVEVKGAEPRAATLKLDFVGVRVETAFDTVEKAQVSVERNDPKPSGRFLVLLDGVTDGYNLVTYDVAGSKREARDLKPGDVFGEFTSLGVIGALYFNEPLMRGLADLKSGSAQATLLKTLKDEHGIELNADVNGSDTFYNIILTKEKMRLRFLIGKGLSDNREVLKMAVVEADVDGTPVIISESLETEYPLRNADPKSEEIKRRFTAINGAFKSEPVAILPF